MARSTTRSSTVLVIGLGRFGAAVAHSLIRMGHEVLGIDANPALVQTHVGPAHPCRPGRHHRRRRAARSWASADFDRAVVGIGSDIEASVLTVLALAELGVPVIWAKATNERHGRILESTGARHVVYPEARMGERVAHMVTGKMIDYIEFDDNYAIVKTRAPAQMAGQTLAGFGVRSKFGVTIVGIKRPKEDFTYARPETLVEEGDLLIVSGRTDLVETFSAIT